MNLIEINHYIREIEKSETVMLLEKEKANALGVSYRVYRNRMTSENPIYINPKTLVHYTASGKFLALGPFESVEKAQESVVKVEPFNDAIDKHKPRNVSLSKLAENSGFKRSAFITMMKTEGRDLWVSSAGEVFYPVKSKK